MPVPLYDDPIFWNSDIYFDGGFTTDAPRRVAPTLSGLMREAPDYKILGTGYTDRVFLLGHGDSALNDPKQVVSMREAVKALQYDSSSPLLRGMLECYYAGCRDIYIMSVAPMAEYVSDVSMRNTVSSSVAGKTVVEMVATDNAYEYPARFSATTWNSFTFYQRYFERLKDAYSLLLEWDSPQIVVPLQASFLEAGTVDFLGQLANHCLGAFDVTGSIRLGLLGGNVPNGTTSTYAASILEDERLPIFDIDDSGSSSKRGKFVGVFLGEGTYMLQEMPVAYIGSVIASIAGLLSTMPLDQGVTYKKIPNVSSLVGPNIPNGIVASCSDLGVNMCAKTTMGRRGRSFEVVSLTDNTLSKIDSDYWSMLQVRLIMRIVDKVRTLGRRYLGTIGFGQFKLELQQYFSELSSANVLRSFNLDISMGPDTDSLFKQTAYVNITVQPYFGLRTIAFTTEVGPGI